MLITSVRATVRVSHSDSEHGWRTVELGAEATIYPGENWQNAQQDLYADLDAEARALLVDGHHDTSRSNGSSPQSQPATPPEIAETPEGWCPIHKVQMPKHTKGSTSWHSHQLPDGNWCKGK